MTYQQGSLRGVLPAFMDQFGWWDIFIPYHETITFKGRMVFISYTIFSFYFNVYFEVKNAFPDDLEIQIYWLSKQ